MKRKKFVSKSLVPVLILVILSFFLFQGQSIFAQSEKDLKTIFEKTMPMWNKGDMSLVDQYYSPEYIRHSVGIFEDIVGHDAFKKYVGDLHVSYPDFHVKLGMSIEQDNMVVTQWYVKATNTGPIGEAPPTDKVIDFHGVTITKVIDGKIVEEWVYWNHAKPLIQLGNTITPPVVEDE